MRCCLTLFALTGLGLTGLWLVGCEAQGVPVAVPPPTVTTTGDESSLTTDDVLAPTVGSTTGDSLTPAATTDENAATPDTAAAPAADGAMILSPDNTKIQFVGTHSPPKEPDPRVGTFAKFSGKADVDAAAKTLKSVSVEIDTTSLTTDIPKLTDHLKSGDFFEVNEFPTAKFESTKIEQDGETATITGNLTLHGVTKEISFPATVSVGENGLALSSEFEIDRTQFGMTFGDGQVENAVTLTVKVGK
jgi:polyisoprenoid-binding protein YceI